MDSLSRMATSCDTMIRTMNRSLRKSTLGEGIRLFASTRSNLSCPSRAPPSILNVLPGQPVELRVAKHTDEDYVAPKRTGFSGSGNRLGAPVPGGDSSQASGSSMPGSFPSSSSPAPSSEGARESISTKFEVDQSKPTTSIQIRLADGTRYASISYIQVSFVLKIYTEWFAA